MSSIAQNGVAQLTSSLFNFSTDPIYLAALDAAIKSAPVDTSVEGVHASTPLSIPSQARARYAAGASPGGFSSSLPATIQPPPPPPPPPRRLGTNGPAEAAAATAMQDSAPAASAVPVVKNVSCADTLTVKSNSVPVTALHPPSTPASTAKALKTPKGKASAVASGAGAAVAGGTTPDASVLQNNVQIEKAGQPALVGAKQVATQGSKQQAVSFTSKAPRSLYEAHLEQEQLHRGLKRGHMCKGTFRLNLSRQDEAYISVPGLDKDILIKGARQHNRAIQGDEVAVALMPLHQWWCQPGASSASTSSASASFEGGNGRGAGSGGDQEPWLQEKEPAQVVAVVLRLLAENPSLRVTGKVVAILNPSPQRERLVGVLEAQTALPTAVSTLAGSSAKELTILFRPLDPRVPSHMLVKATEVACMPEPLKQEACGSDVEARTLMSARIVDWPATSSMPVVALGPSLGQAGQIESETAAIILAEDVRNEPFNAEVLACLPPTPWSIGPEEIAKRRDFRSTRVFSIDPPTAKDLDDALSIEPLPNGGHRVGVHIADVAHFIPPYSALDVEAGMRATSVYLVQRVVPMLPPLLCEELCSLNPGVERLAFSVVWDLDADGKIQSQWAGRSIICSCAKLSYPMVQAMIEERFDRDACPAQLHGGYSWDEVIHDSLTLHAIARHLRAERFSNGALRLDNMKLFYKMDKDGNPISAAPYVQAEANQLVEEFMLLANMSVARLISVAFPDKAMLRRHAPPDDKKLRELESAATFLGLDLDIASSAGLQTTLASVRNSVQDPGLVDVLTMLATKPMQLANYFCTGEADDPGSWRHYALAVDAYTHFTSPIRRYPDVVVHRLLAAALDMQQNHLSPEETATKHRLLECTLAGKVAQHCNDQRLKARNAQDASLKLYLCVLLHRQPTVADGVITQLNGNQYFDIYLPAFGHTVRVETCELGIPHHAKWQPGPKVLLLESAPTGSNGASNGTGHASPGFSNGGGRGRGRAGTPGRGNNSTSNGAGVHTSSNGGGGSAEPPPDFGAWLASLPPLHNPLSIQPMALPLQLSLYGHVSVVLTSKLELGRPSGLIAKIFLDTEQTRAVIAAADASRQEAVQADTAGAGGAMESVSAGAQEDEAGAGEPAGSSNAGSASGVVGAGSAVDAGSEEPVQFSCMSEDVLLND